MTTETGTLVITGATGFVGSRVTRAAHEAGWKVDAWARHTPAEAPQAGVTWQRYVLTEPLPASGLPMDCAAVIHCAHDMDPANANSIAQNLTAADRLRALTLSHPHARFVFLSSQSAHPRALSRYGRSKFAIEGRMGTARDLVLKPGFVVGPGGVYARLRQVLLRLPVVPLFYGGDQPVHPVWIGDVVQTIIRAVRERIQGTVILGYAPAITVRAFYEFILQAEGVTKPFVHLPGAFAAACLRIAESAGLHLPLNSEHLQGLRALIAFDEAIACNRWLGRFLPPAEAVRLARQALIEHA